MPTRLIVNLSIALIAMVILFIIAILLQPEWLMNHLRRRSPKVLYSIDTSRPIVALTIDDGPDRSSSPQILELLREYKAHATFFLITDRVNGNEAIIRQMITEGHELGNHLTKDEPSITLTSEEFEQNLIKADKILSKFSDVVWVRPGSGWFNEEMLEIVEKHDYQVALGSVYPYDPQIGLTWYSANYVLWKVKPGAVIVLHDYQKRGQRTVDTLEMILPKLAERGYQIVTLSDLAALQH